MDVHVSARYKVIGVPGTPRIVSLFPKAKVVEWNGKTTTLLPHGLEETRALRGLGYNVPAPILTQYNWAGGTPFDVQRHTCALMTTEARAYILNDMGCVDADTEYLSPTGWVRIADYVGGRVAQYEPSTGVVSFVEPTEYVKLPCREMIRFKTTRGIDQLLSPEHRVLLADGRVYSADYIEGTYTTTKGREYKIPTTFTVTGTTGMPLSDDDIRLQVAVNADAYERDDWDKVAVRLKRPRKIARMRALLTATGIPYKETPCTPIGFIRFTFKPPMGKGFGSEWWEASQHQLEVIAEEATHWDGHFRRAGGHVFSAYRKHDADFIQYAYSASGRRASLNTNTRTRRGHAEVEYVVHAKNGPSAAGLYGVSQGKPRINIWREASPDGYKYCFMVPSTFLVLRRNGKIFATGNTGKTKCALWAFDYLRKLGLAKRMLVIAPLSTLNMVWKAEVLKTVPHLSVGVLHSSDRRKRLKVLEEDHAIYVINTDGIKVLSSELQARKDIDTLCIDELSMFRNGRADRTKVLLKLTQRMVWAWGMTGSPTPTDPTDAWSQCRILTPATVPLYFSRFREETMVKINSVKWVPKRDANDVVFKVMQPAVRYTLDDVVELPPVIERYMNVEMGAKQTHVYEEIRKHAYIAYEKHEITAVNAAAVYNKLLQTSMGYVYAKGRGVVALDNDIRLNALVDAVNSTSRKVLVFVPFTHALTGVRDRLAKEHIETALVHGETSKGTRDRIFNAFQNTSKFKVIAAHPGCMSHGLTLTAADTVIWFGPPTSLELFEQANARVRRIGQRHKQLILMMQGTPAEKRTYARLQTRQQVQDNLLEMFAADTQTL